MDDDNSSSKPMDDTSRPYTVMIACVTVEVAMVVSPAMFYEPDEIHLFSYIRDPEASKSRIYRDHYERVRGEIFRNLPRCRIIEHKNIPIYKFDAMAQEWGRLRVSLSKTHPDTRILVNMSSGPTEYISSATLFSFFNDNVEEFKVSTEEFTVSEEDFIKMHYRDGIPCGLSYKVSEPQEIDTVPLEKPSENGVRALRLYAEFIEYGMVPQCRRMIDAMKKAGIWDYDEKEYDKVHFMELDERERHYFLRMRDRWRELGWLDEDDKGRVHGLSKRGKAVIRLFYPDD